MSEMAISMSDQSGSATNANADGLAQVRDRIWETSEQLKRRVDNSNNTRRRKYKRKNIPQTEKERRQLKLVTTLSVCMCPRSPFKDIHINSLKAPSVSETHPRTPAALTQNSSPANTNDNP